MPKYIVDENLPYYFSIWNNSDYVHINDIKRLMSDKELWEYARTNKLTIISKDTDFSDRIIASLPPPKIIHIKFGNLRLKDMYRILSENWNEVIMLSEKSKLVNIYIDRLEAIE